MYCYGYTHETDFRQARQYFKLAVAMKFLRPEEDERRACIKAAGQALLGQLYFNGGYGIEQNFALALHFFQLAEKQLYDVWSTALACAHMGIMYQMGYGVIKDERLARIYFERATKQNSNQAAKSLGQKWQNSQYM